MQLPRYARIGMAMAAIAAIAIGITVLYLYNPQEHSFYPRCPFFVWTGLKCPGCGTARAMHQLVHGNVLEAIRFNGMLVAVIPVLVAIAFSDKCRKSVWLGRAVLAATLVWWVARNFIGI